MRGGAPQSRRNGSGVDAMQKGRRGQGLVEYALIIVLIAIGVIGGLTAFKNGLAQTVNYATSQISSSLSSGS